MPALKFLAPLPMGNLLMRTPEKVSVAILLLDINPGYFTSCFLNTRKKTIVRLQEHSEKAKQLFQHPAFLIAGSHMETDAEQLLFGFEDAIGKQVNVFGGMAGDDYAFTEQYVFTNDKESNRGMVVLAFDEDKIKIKGRATCGWKAVGTEKTVTKSEGNHVFTVDNVPVLDINS